MYRRGNAHGAGFSEIQCWDAVSSVRGFVETDLPYQKCPPLGVWLSSSPPWLVIVSIPWGWNCLPYQSTCPFSGVQFILPSRPPGQRDQSLWNPIFRLRAGIRFYCKHCCASIRWNFHVEPTRPPSPREGDRVSGGRSFILMESHLPPAGGRNLDN